MSHRLLSGHDTFIHVYTRAERDISVMRRECPTVYCQDTTHIYTYIQVDMLKREVSTCFCHLGWFKMSKKLHQ